MKTTSTSAIAPRLSLALLSGAGCLFPAFAFAFAADPAPEAPTELAPAVVTAKAETAPTTAATTASDAVTKTGAPLHDTPQSVTVISAETIREQGAREMKDALRNATSVTPAQGEGRRDQFYIRGFDAVRDTLLDGMRDDSLYYRDLATLERVEVIQGPAAALYGRGSAGGVINRVSKKPVFETLAEAGFTGGSFALRRGDIDAGDGLGEAFGGRFGSRFVGVYEASDSYRDIVNSEKWLIAPSLAYEDGDGTTILAQTEYLNQSRTPDRGIPSLNGKPADVPVGNFYGEKFDYAKTDAASIRLGVNHRASERLSVRNNFMFSSLELDAANTRTLGLTDDKLNVHRQTVYFPQDQTNWLNQTEVVAKIDGDSVRHTLLGGLELGWQEANNRVAYSIAPTVSLQNPQHVAPRPDFAALPFRLNYQATALTTALYAQDTVEFGEHWKLLGGVRFDRVEQKRHNRINGLDQQREDALVSPRAGLVCQPVKEISLYGNVSYSSQPIGGDLTYYSGPDLETLNPTRTLQEELGVKGEWFDKKLTATVAVFNVTQSDVATQDPADPERLVQTGEQRSRGVDASVACTVIPRLKLIGGYTRNKAIITKSNDYDEGNRVGNIPKHAASFWGVVDIGAGFFAGAGVTSVGSRYAMEDNTVRLPSYARYDATAGYRAKNWELTANVYNLADTVYYEAANNNNQIQPGAPLSFAISARIRF